MRQSAARGHGRMVKPGKATIFVIDDDEYVLGLMARFLTEAGHTVHTSGDSAGVVERVLALRPDAVVFDLVMPHIDGLEICHQLRQNPDLGPTVKLIAVSAKSYDYDRRKARELGADGFIAKPVDRDRFVREVERILADKVELRFWGVRGTLPVPGPRSVRYGGNTSCVTMGFTNDRLFVFDAGTGIKALSTHLLGLKQRVQAKLFITHPHWDHINALPFFVPMYIQGNDFEILGASHGSQGMEALVNAQMDGVFFPITTREFGSRVTYRDLREGSYVIDGVTVDTMMLSHPGYCLGYKVTYKGRKLAYITDNELFLPDHPMYDRVYVERLINFVRGADVLITDTNYMDEVYPMKVGWGHSSVGQVVRLAHAAEVKGLYLFHHDPDQSDDDIDIKLDRAAKMLAELKSSTQVVAPAEGDVLYL